MPVFRITLKRLTLEDGFEVMRFFWVERNIEYHFS